ncbi:hypothetical protein [Variovorax sp. OV329]|uniref:hypothetical protein n=1 Tax=Variovorax sp. OV329 TaxID=1882825 RepID=UPI0008F34C17|nr:hypothetical protein [Variovorax sp. OV329]SFN41191.1 hypothetical protein SAMN05444747_12524 [Variovorax sp. OV329]
MNLDLHHVSRRQFVAMALVVSALLPLSNCGGGTDEGVSDMTATSSRSTDTVAGLITPDVQQAAALADGEHWGAAPSAALSRNPQAWLPAMSEAGITSVRNFHAVANDDQLAPILASGMSAVGILQWSSKDPPFALPVDDLAGWRNYVTQEVRRHKGKVKYWEVWNEPPNFTEDKSPRSYAQVVAAAYDAAKAVDASVQVGLAAKSNHVNWLAETIEAGAADKFDFVTLHPYEVADLLPEGWEGQFMSIVPRVRSMLRARNPARAGVPVWFTEIGASAAAPPPGRIGGGAAGQADSLAKIYTMAFAQGVSRVYWFDPRDSEGLSMGLTTADGAKRPAWFAMRSMTTHLGPRPSFAGWLQPGNAWYGFVFLGPQGVVLSAWARPGQSATLSLPSEVQKVDPRTGAATTTRTPTLGAAPSILVAPAGSATALQWLTEATANLRKPFPWNGDHSASTSVQLTAGERPDGVFIVHPPAVTVADGQAEFDVEGSIGACFAVDPVFMSYAYAARPVHITAQLRGHGSGDPGFTLVYESGAPIAATDGNNLKAVDSGWFRIRGTSLREKTWTLPDARFVGLYGYNFCFYAPTPDNARFSIRQVTVRR